MTPNQTPMALAITQSRVSPSFWQVQDLRWYKGGTHVMDDFGTLVRVGWPQFAAYCSGNGQGH